MDILPQSVLVMDKEGVFFASNRSSALNPTGLRSEFLMDIALNLLPIHDQRKAEIQNITEQVIEQKTVAYHSFEVSEHGKTHVINTSFTPLFHEGESVGVLMSSEVGEAKNGPFASWEALFGKSNENYVCVNRDKVVLATNFKTSALRSLDQVGASLDGLLMDEDRTVFNAAFASCIESAEVRRFDVPLGGKWFTFTLSPWTEANLTTHVVIRMDDITTLHNTRLEEEGRIALLNDALSGAEEGVFLIHLGGRIVFRNQTSYHFVASNAQHIQDLMFNLDGHLFDLESDERMTPDSLGIFKSLDDQSSRKQQFGLETNSGRKIIESNVQPLERSSSGGLYFLWTIRDITNEMEQIADLKEANAEMDNFVRAAAHDLRAPVSVVYNLAKLIEGSDDPNRIKDLGIKIASAAKQLTSIFQSMMELAESRQAHTRSYEIVPFEDVIREVKGTLIDLNKGACPIFMDLEETEIAYNRAFLRSIIYNLLNNACKYRDPEKLEHRVDIRVLSATNGVWLEVQDNGVGMNLKKVGRDLFQPFRRLSTVGEGSGVGLSLVKNFAEKNGGEIHVESEPGVGTTFRVLLRSYKPDQQQYELFES